VVGHSFGAFTTPLVAERLSADLLVLIAGMIPKPGESPEQWWADSGYSVATQEQSALDGGLTGNDDPYVSFYNDAPRDLALERLGVRADEVPGGHCAMLSRPVEIAEMLAGYVD